MARTVYIVGHNMAGYMPECDLWYARTKKDAVKASRDEAKRDQEDLSSDWEPYHRSGKDGSYWLSRDDGPTYHYWIHPVMAVRVVFGSVESRHCVNCECGIDEGERVYFIPETDEYLCDTCR